MGSLTAEPLSSLLHTTASRIILTSKTSVRVVLYYQINIDPDLIITSVTIRHLLLNGCFSQK